MSSDEASASALRRVTRGVVALNLCFFVAEVTVGLRAGSVSLIADSIDFLEDASIGLLVLASLTWSLRAKAWLGMALAGVLLMPSLATLVVAWRRLDGDGAPDASLLTLMGLGALAVNAVCSFLLAGQRKTGGSLVRAAFLSARNDALASVAIIVAGLVTGLTGSRWPDVVVGFGIAALNIGAAHEVFQTARNEHRGAGVLG